MSKTVTLFSPFYFPPVRRNACCYFPNISSCNTSFSSSEHITSEQVQEWVVEAAHSHYILQFYDPYNSLGQAQLLVYCSRLTVKPVICKQTSPNFLRFTTLAGLGRGSFTTSNRPQPASNSSRRQLEHFRFYTSAIFIASLALHAQTSLYPLERESLREAGRKRQITILHAQKKRKTGVDEGCQEARSRDLNYFVL